MVWTRPPQAKTRRGWSAQRAEGERSREEETALRVQAKRVEGAMLVYYNGTRAGSEISRFTSLPFS